MSLDDFSPKLTPKILPDVYSLQRNSLYRAAHIPNFEGILGFSVPSIILVKAGLMEITM